MNSFAQLSLQTGGMRLNSQRIKRSHEGIVQKFSPPLSQSCST
ncbi:MAG TPA: hypothetical protein V6D27_09480 [Vampirovibrionales bacterium]